MGEMGKEGRGEGKAGRSGIILDQPVFISPCLSHSLDAPGERVLAWTLRISSLCEPHPSPSRPIPRLDQVSGAHWCPRLPCPPARVFSVSSVPPTHLFTTLGWVPQIMLPCLSSPPLSAFHNLFLTPAPQSGIMERT